MKKQNTLSVRKRSRAKLLEDLHANESNQTKEGFIKIAPRVEGRIIDIASIE